MAVPITLAITKKLKADYEKAQQRLILLDYDGSLAEFVDDPKLAVPSQEIISCLKSLAADHKNTAVIISGRDKVTLDQWLGKLPIGLAAEHGAFYKDRSGWHKSAAINEQWKAEIKQLLQGAAESAPGTFVEEKQTSLVFHYRSAEDKSAAKQVAKELAADLAAMAGPTPLSVVAEARAVEVRQAGIDKGRAAVRWLNNGRYDFILAAGDSATDEDMFQALPKSAITIKIREGETAAHYQIKDQGQLLELLCALT